MSLYLKLFALGVVTFLAACQSKDSGSDAAAGSKDVESAAVVSGSVSYRERLALSDNALVEIILQDVSRTDAPAEVLARQRISRPGQVPVRFRLSYDPAEIDERMSYAVSARISEGDQLMFISDTVYPVLTRGAGSEVHMILKRVVGEAETPETELEGMFRYLGGAALFRDCSNGRSYPVSMEGAFYELKSAYLASGIRPGNETMVRLKGRFLERPSVNDNTNNINLVVDFFHELLPEESCSPTDPAELLDTYWRLDNLGGTQVIMAEGREEAHMILASSESRVNGNAGCNRFFGQYQVEANRLSFSSLGATMMACPDSMETEQAFLAALNAAASYTISGPFLSLFDAEGNVQAVFEAAGLP